MANTVTNAVKDTMLDSIDATFNSGVLTIRTGAAPGANAAPTGTILVTITLPADAFAAASAGSKAKAGTWQDATADATGTAAHYRIVTSSDGGGSSQSDPRIEGTVTATGGGGDIELDSTSITAGQVVTITAYTLTQAAA